MRSVDLFFCLRISLSLPDLPRVIRALRELFLEIVILSKAKGSGEIIL